MMVFRSAIADWNQVPSGSMKPSILVGDRIVVDKIAYDLRIPFTLTRIARWAEPQRGDVVTFPSPRDETLYVKRVIGLPGDIVELRKNHLYVNGEAARYRELSARDIDALDVDNKSRYAFYYEELGAMSHIVMLRRDSAGSSYQSFPPTEVPQHGYLMLGDNRDDSGDFRVIGWVDRERILGRAHAIAFSLDYEHHYVPRFARFFGSLTSATEQPHEAEHNECNEPRRCYQADAGEQIAEQFIVAKTELASRPIRRCERGQQRQQYPQCAAFGVLAGLRLRGVSPLPRMSRRPLRLVDREQFDLEDQRLIGSDAIAGAPLLVRKVRRHDDAPLRADRHQLQRLDPAGNDAIHRERCRLAIFDRTIEYRAVDQRAGVVGRHSVVEARLRSGPGTSI